MRLNLIRFVLIISTMFLFIAGVKSDDKKTFPKLAFVIRVDVIQDEKSEEKCTINLDGLGISKVADLEQKVKFLTKKEFETLEYINEKFTKICITIQFYCKDIMWFDVNLNKILMRSFLKSDQSDPVQPLALKMYSNTSISPSTTSAQ